MFFFDPMYLLFALPGMALVMWAQYKVKSTFHKYAQVRNMTGLSGYDVARRLMSNEGLDYLRINQVPGELTDFYNPADKSINLSQSSMMPSIGSIAVVAHELGHAVQDKKGYVPMRIRGSIVGIANIGSQLGVWLVVLGLMFSAGRGGFGFTMAVAGLLLFSASVAFTLVTLPVEFNASRRAREMLLANGLITPEEEGPVREVLNAAAMTYVAAAASSILTFMYFAFRVFGSDRR